MMNRRYCATFDLICRCKSKPSFCGRFRRTRPVAISPRRRCRTTYPLALMALETPAKPAGLRTFYTVPAAIFILLLAGASVWFYQRSEKRHWAREQAIPEVARLTDRKKPLAAYRLLQEAQKYLPGDPQLAQIADSLTHVVSVQSSPPGASVEIKDYLSPSDAWSPLRHNASRPCQDPNGYLRWRVSKTGAGEYIPALRSRKTFMGSFVNSRFHWPLRRWRPKEWSLCRRVSFSRYSGRWETSDPMIFPPIIDQLRSPTVNIRRLWTEADIRNREYWKEKFVRGGKELSWPQGNPICCAIPRSSQGPSTWVAGRYRPDRRTIPSAESAGTRPRPTRHSWAKPPGDCAMVPGGAECGSQIHHPVE